MEDIICTSMRSEAQYPGDIQNIWRYSLKENFMKILLYFTSGKVNSEEKKNITKISFINHASNVIVLMCLTDVNDLQRIFFKKCIYFST